MPLRTRAALGGMGVGGTVPESFLHTDPARLEMLGIRWVEVPDSALLVSRNPGPEDLKLELVPGGPRFFPLPVRPATEIRLVSWMTDAVEVRQDAVVAWAQARLASGRGFDLPVRAGVDTAEWAHDRSDVAERVRHQMAEVAESWPGPDGTFLGHWYRTRLRLPGRYYVDGLRLERVAGPGRLMLARLSAFDALTQRLTPVSAASAYVSDGARLREVAATPSLRLFEVPGAEAARVVGRVRVMPSEDAVVRALDLLPQIGLDPRKEAVVSPAEAKGLTLAEGARASRADPTRLEPGRLDLRAEGPGLLVVSEAWDPGWSARVDGRGTRVFRVDHAQIGVVLPPGRHHVSLRYRVRGLQGGLVLAGLAAAGLALAARGGRV